MSSAYTPKVASLLEVIAFNGNALSENGANDPTRRTLLAAVRTLTRALETPVESITRIAWAEPTQNTAARIAIDLGLFEELTKDDGVAKSSSQLAAVAGADVRLVSRIMKHLAAMEIVGEISADVYVSTPLSMALTVPKYRDGISYCFDCPGPVFQKLPAYLSKIGYKCPDNALDGPFQHAHETTLPSIEWKKQRPPIISSFANHMAGYRQGRTSWMDRGFYPVEERLGPGLKTAKDEVLMVDVGGGVGHDLKEFRTKHPQLPGRLILQDRAEIIDRVEDSAEIEPMVHDFYTLQPIKGARAYYLHSVLHDWTDDRCRIILQQIMRAMEKGYSKILINENVIPDIGASWLMTSLDMIMMAHVGSQERAEKQWRDLLSSVGLKIVNIWTYEPGTESLIEAVLDEA